MSDNREMFKIIFKIVNGEATFKDRVDLDHLSQIKADKFKMKSVVEK